MLYLIVFKFCLFWIVCSGILKLYETETETLSSYLKIVLKRTKLIYGICNYKYSKMISDISKKQLCETCDLESKRS